MTPRSKEPDKRLTASEVTKAAVSPTGRPIPVGSHVILMQRVRLLTGEVLMFPAPQMVSLYLIESRMFAIKGERKRLLSLKQVRQEKDHIYPTNHSLLIDAVRDLSLAVLLAYSAIESLCNATIDDLPIEAAVVARRASQNLTVSRDEMVRRLSLGEKLDLALPLYAAAPSIKGTKSWEGYKALKSIRDELVHPKKRSVSFDPDDPSVIGRLLRGDASNSYELAHSVISNARPDWPLDG